MAENPFERWDLDPQASPKELTARFRELVERLQDEGAPAELLAELRADWEELTGHPRERATLALRTFAADPRPTGRSPRRRFGAPPSPPTPRERVDLPSVAQALGMSFDSERHRSAQDLPDLPLSRDPLFREDES